MALVSPAMLLLLSPAMLLLQEVVRMPEGALHDAEHRFCEGVARVNVTAFTAVIKCDLLCPDFHETQMLSSITRRSLIPNFTQID